MAMTLFTCDGGSVALPDPRLVLVSRLDGGNLIVLPPRDVWERSELAAGELKLWASLVSAAGRSMLDTLPQLRGGCINYWEAGNWALHDDAEPKGPKTPAEHRHVHLHLLGRSPRATHPSWRWGEAPKFPDFVRRHAWASAFEPLNADECCGVVAAIERRLRDRFGFEPGQLRPWSACSTCGYPAPDPAGHPHAAP